MFLALITRHLNEPFLQEFIDYYFNEGVDHIYILQDSDGSLNIKQQPRVFTSRCQKFGTKQMHSVNELYKTIRNKYKWFISVDCDEYMSCVNAQKKKSLREILQTEYAGVDCVAVPWVMMSCHNVDRNPPSLLQYNMHRWDHDKKHPHPNSWQKGRCRYDEIEVKCMFKGSAFRRINIHHPDTFVASPIAVESVSNGPFCVQPFFKNLHEKEIAMASVLCFHYRIMSKQASAAKFRKNKLPGYRNSQYDNLMITNYCDKEERFMREKSICLFGEK